MASVTATINVQINAANAAAQLTALQGKVAAMNKGMLAATAGGVMAQEKAIRRMGNVLSGSGMFTTGIRNVHTELGRMHQEFDRGSTTLQKYRQNSRMWGRDHSAINRMAADRVRMLQSQYVALGKEMNGVQKSMQIKPDRMMREFGADAMYAHQRAMLFRRNLQMGSTALVNWGKNTQWAGRQMMVGMGIPIAIAAAGAVKAFNDIEKASISFKRVYGDATTSVAEKSQMLSKMQATVGKEMMKYGVSMSDTLEVSAQAAATGAKGADLIAATRETMRLATLGNMDYNKALGATIAMQTAFNINAKDMASTTDFLNAVENQTILTMEDMASAVPRVAPVIKGLGGNVQDLAIMMTALRQGGVTAEQGANALKSGLGSLLNPTGTAIDQFDSLGINLQKIVDTNKGDLIGTIKSLGKELDGLGKYDRQRALESLFGKYQYSRMGALLKNINSKAAKETMRLAKANTSELAKMSQQELDQISSSPMIKLRASIEELKAAAAPLGALFSDVAAKIVSFATPIVSFFANNDIAKWGLVATAGFAALAGVVTMIVGVFANFTGSMIKAGMAVKSFFRLITGQRSLAYVTTDELEASAAANSLATAAERAAGGMMAEAKAAQLLTSQLEALIAAQNGAASTSRRPSPGTTGVPVAPKPSGPGGTPIPAQTSRTPLSATEMALLNRTHLGGLRNLSKDEITKILGYQGLSKNVSRDLQNALATGQVVQGGNARTMLMPREWNEKLANSGVRANVLADQLSRQGRNLSMAPLMQTIGASAGMSHAAIGAWATQGAGAALSSQIYDRIYSDIAAQGTNIIKDADLQRIADTAIDDIAANTSDPKLRKALEQSGMISRVSINGSGSTSIAARSVVGAQYDAGLSGGIPTLVQQHNADTHVAPSSIGPGQEVTPNGLVVPKGTMEEQRQTARETSKLKPTTSTSTGSTYAGLMNNWDKPKPVQPGSIKDRYQRSLAKKQLGNRMPGMGLMGAGMLAQTAVIGMEMAGKEVPSAVNYAVNGLMGIGMASMFFPTTMQKVTSGIEVAIKSLGPFGLAIGAAAVAIGGTALLWKRMNEQTRQQGIDLGKSLNDTTSNIDDVGTAFGKTSYVQQDVAKQQGTTTEQITAAKQFMESETGKKLLEQYTSESLKIGQNVAGTSLASKLASYVINGVMGTSDVKAFLGALKTENPAQGAQVERYVRGLMGGKMGKMPGTLANDIYKLQSDNTATTLKLMESQREQIAGTSLWDTFKNADLKTKGLTALKMVTNPFSAPGELGVMELQRQMDVRGSMNRVGGLMASATNTQIQSGLQNRLALEAQLNMLLEERDDLQKRSKEGDLAEADAKRLNYLNKAIPDTRKGIAQLGDALQQTSVAMDKMFEQSGNDDQKNAVLESLNTMIQDTKDATAIFMSDMAMNSDIGMQDKFGIMSKLANGSLNPAGMQNMLAYGKLGIDGIASSVNSLPVDKLQTFSLEIGKMTGPQAQSALTNFGKRFVNAATAAKLSGKEAKDAAKALGATPKQAKQVKVAVKMDKIKDLTKGVDKNVTVAANTDSAKKKIDDLRKAAEKATGKKIKINASDNAGAVISRLRKLIKAAEEADSQDPDVTTSTNAPSTTGKLKTLSEVIGGIADPGPINIGANDEATPVAQEAADALNLVTGLNPNPTITVASNAATVANSAQQSMNSVQNVTRYIDIYERRHKASGGMFYANGGIHKGDGKVRGEGGPTDDKVNARLSNGEFVIRAKSVSKYGTAFLDAVNRGAYEKQAYKSGTPLKGTKTPLPPKESEGKGRKADFNNEWRNILYEASNFVKEFAKMSKIIKHGKAVLGKQFKHMDYEFGRWIMDNYSPRQIKKMFGGKEKGAKKLARQYRAEQKLATRDEVNQQKTTLKNAKLKNQLLLKNNAFGEDNATSSAISGLSDEQLQMYRGIKKQSKKDAFIKRIVDAEKVQEQQSIFTRKRDVGKQYNAATGRTMFDTAADVSKATGVDMNIADLQQAADALGMSIDDIAEQIKNGDLPANFADLATKAKQASKAMEVLAMSQGERNAQFISNNQSRMSTYEDVAAAQARSKIGAKYGVSQGVLEAQNAVRDAQNAIDQATIDDINEKYDKQLETFNQISQVQQAIANLERGRLSVANALSAGDIAAAAAAAQEQRANTAAFMQDQMRNQLENQQKAQTAALQDAINERMRTTRDIQNQIALELATQNAAVAPTIAAIQQQNDDLIQSDGYIAAANAEYEAQNALLVLNNDQLTIMLANLAAAANIPTPTISTPSGNVTRAAAGASVAKPTKKKGKKGKGKAFGGWVPGVGNSDNVPLLATPGEFVMRKAAAARFGPTLQAMNAGTLKSVGGSGGVQIDNIIFNINGANLNERDIAEIAVRKMKSLDSATIRGGRF